MDKASAQGIVSKTFKAAFDKKRYRDFINELCNGFNESKAISSMGVPDAFSDHIKSCQRLGTFESADGELADVLIVHLTESFKLERTRTALRDFVAHKLKRDDSYKEAGLVAFVAPDSQSWRFSYVRMEYETKRDPDTGKIKTEERLTPARRFSYLVGVDEECHTAQSRFLALLQNTTDKPTLAQIENAFSVESVTKEFFGEYARLFVTTEAALSDLVKNNKTLRTDFEAKHVNTADFTKKLLGQIVFLYFIQKKGWLGVPKGGKWGDGPRNFLRVLANQANEKKQCLFNDVLEPLFYDTLATDRGHEAWCETFQCRIPFLNGGLFEPLAGYDWENTEITLPNTLLTNRETNKAGDIGTGILDVFDRYNFTVMEDEPLEKEVAIDPEMLGKVFENLIEENRRKGRGTFYTPREIVHYMCQESLINYLDTALNHPLKPIGMVTAEPESPPLFVDSDELPKEKIGQQEFLEATTRILVPREELAEWIGQSDQFAHYAAAIAAGTKGDHYPKPHASIRKYAREIDALLNALAVCDPAAGSGAFLVGMMTEIVRARMALTPYFNDVAERSAYHFKRRAIQYSLYGVDIDAGAVEIAKLRLWLSLVVDEEDVRQIKPLPNLDYKIVSGNSLIGYPFNSSERIRDIEKLKRIHFDETDHDKKAVLKEQIDLLIHECFANSRKILGYEVAFDFEIYFSDVFQTKGGFDVVIANPPYLKERDNKQVFDVVTSSPWGKKYHAGKMDYWFFFLHRALEITNAAGIASFITSRYWLNSSGAKKLIEHIRLDAALFHVVDIGKLPVFEQVAGHHMLHFYQRGAKQSLCLVKTLEGSLDDIAAFESSDHLKISEQTADDLFTSNGEMRLYKATLSLATVLTIGDHYEVTQGVVQNPDRVSAVMAKRYCLSQGNGVFVLEPTEFAALSLSSVELPFVRPFYDESAVRRFHLKRSVASHLLYLTKNNCPDIRNLPNLARHLMPYREIMDARRETVKGTIQWFQLHWPREPRYFDSPKVVLPSMFSVPNAAYVPEPAYFGMGSNVVIGGNKSFSLKLLCALLNSKVGAWWFATNGKKRGAGVDVGVDRLRHFPLPNASARFAEVEKLVDRIIAAKAKQPNADTSDAEQNIDELVYTLYGLTPDEIALIEAAH